SSARCSAASHSSEQMPELPEMQVYRDRIAAEFSGAKLQKFSVSRAKKVDAALEIVEAGTVGHALEAVDRIGKELVFRFKSGDAIGVHLMIAGRFKSRPAGDEPP